MTHPQLEAFILAHDTNITSKSQLLAKGKLKDAKDDTLKNRIRLTFDCRMMPNKIEAVLPFDLSDEQPYDNKAENIVFIRSHLPMMKQFSQQNYLVIHRG